jgi:tetratricopeptide (TPR) repeat protein
LSRLRAVVGGDAWLLLVVGDAGVGKTRLVTEGMRRVAVDGVVTIWGGCLPMRETLPLLPVADALGEFYRVHGGDLLEAALATAPKYVRTEVERLVPQLGSGAAGPSAGESGQRDRLFAAIAELLRGAARRRRLVLVVEDVHWADTATLDCLTFLTRASRDSVLTVVVTCRSDEAPLEPHVAEWLTHVRGIAGVAEVRLGPLTRDEMAEQVAGLAGSPVPVSVVDEMYARTEGNPFFTEQLVAAASPEGVLGFEVGLPARLAELLVTRAARCGDTARTVLSALAVAARPLGEDVLGAVSGLDVEDVRGGLRELAAARLLADTDGRGAHRPRHALLAEAVTAELLPSERVVFHERVARALQALGDDTSAAEVAGHWAAAGRAAEELPARVRAAEAAERVFDYAEEVRHWQRAIELFACVPGPEQLAGVDLPHVCVRCLDALWAVGDIAGGGVLADEAYRRFANHPDPAVAASVQLRTAMFRFEGSATDARPLLNEALRLFELVPPSVDHAKAWFSYAMFFLAEGQWDARRAALTRGLEVAEAAGATGVAAGILLHLAHDACLRGQVAEGFAIIERARAQAEASGDGEALVEVAADESDILLKTGRFDRAAEAGLRGVLAGRECGREADLAAANAAEAMLARGRTAEAAELIDPLTDAPPVNPDHYLVHGLRAEIDLLRGDVEAAAGRLQQIRSVGGRINNIDNAGEIGRRTAEVAVWTGRPADALIAVREVLARYQSTDWTIQCGWLLVVGMRACAELIEQGRARRDETATRAAVAAAGDLAAWVDRTGGVPFIDHPYVATIPAARANWEAEHARLTGANDPAAWQAAADAWGALGCRHRAAYAWWRHAEARLLSGDPSAAVAETVRDAAATAAGHVPLLAAIRALAERAHIPLTTVPANGPPATVTPTPTPHGLTEREVLVLRLIVAGRSNRQIGAELFISPKTRAFT